MHNKYLEEKYNFIKEEILNYIIEDAIEVVENMSMFELHQYYNAINEDREKVKRAESRARDVEKKRSKQVDTIHRLASQGASSGKHYGKEYLKKFKGMVTAQRAQKYYAGETKPTEGEKGKGYRAPQSRLD